MEDIIIKGDRKGYFTPSVSFSYDKGICEIEGDSYLEDTVQFYKPLIHWLKKYTQTKRPIILNIKLVYFNTSSSKSLLEMFLTLKDYQDAGNDVEVNWYFPEESFDLQEEIEDYIDDTGLDITLIPY